MSRNLPQSPNLEHLKKQAKVRLRDLQRTNPGAKLSHAQHVIAMEYGFSTWTKLKAHVESRSGTARDPSIAANPGSGGAGGGGGGITAAGPIEPSDPDDSDEHRPRLFPRFTEKARQAIFFARYEANQTNRPEIETEHLLLALTRSAGELMDQLMHESSMALVRQALDRRGRIPTPESADSSAAIPLSKECRRIIDAQRLSSGRSTA